MSSPLGSPRHSFSGVMDAFSSTPPKNAMSSTENSNPASGTNSRPGGKKKVGFTGGSDSAERSHRVSWINLQEADEEQPASSASGHASPGEGSSSLGFQPARRDSGELAQVPTVDRSHLPPLSPQQTQEIHEAFRRSVPISKPRPAIRRTASTPPSHVDPQNEDVDGPDDTGQRAHRQARMREAFERGKRLEEDQRSAPNSRHHSPQRLGAVGEDVELDDLDEKYDDSEDEGIHMPLKRQKAVDHFEAHNLVRRHTRAHNVGVITPPPAYRSGAVTPTEIEAEDYRPAPKEYRGGILGSLLKLYHDTNEEGRHDRHHTSGRRRSGWFHSNDHTPNASRTPTPQHSPSNSGTTTPTGGSSSPKAWFGRKHHKTGSSTSLAQLIGSSASLGSPVVSGLGEEVSRRMREQREANKSSGKRPSAGVRSHSSNALAALNRVARGQRLAEEIRITVHIAETIARQRYLVRLCRALMQYGAPTHRLEEYMRMSARVLAIEAQFLYIPGSMIMSFDDSSTHTTEVKLVRVGQGLDLGKLRDVHETYKDVVHDVIGVEVATNRLKEIMGRKDKHSRWLRIPVYGLAAVCVGPFAFDARLIDLPIAFILGCIVGILQLVVSPASDLYANVFEIMATVVTSFLARAFGSIPGSDGAPIFCFSALAQSSIALILPGYIVLCASLELQSKSIVAGSIRMVYAVIYTLFLGYGITIGTAIYGAIDGHATSSTTCSDPIVGPWKFFFVPGFTLSLIIINQAKWKQAPVMLVIAFAGYIVNYYSSLRFPGNTQVSNTLGALAIGVLANSYSRLGGRVENWTLDLWEDKLRVYWKRFRRAVFGVHSSKKQSAKSLEDGTSADESVLHRQPRRIGYSLAAAAMLPAIFVQVPSGLAANGSLISGIASANQISGVGQNGTQVVNGTTIGTASDGLNSLAFNVSYSVIQVAIGITVGLFLSAIVVYPLGKRRSGLFSL